MMKRIVLIGLVCLAAVESLFAAFSVTAKQVTVQDLTTDKNNFFVTVKGETSSGEYELAFDVWPASHSAIGSFSKEDGTIGYVSSYVHKTKANGSSVNMWYYPEEDAAISLSIVKKDETTCTLSGSITASRNGTAYTYTVSAFDFAYAEGDVEPEPEQDPYRFEPTTATTINFIADVINFRQREGYIEVTLNEMANETYDWIDLRLLSDTMLMPAGVYTINDTYAPGTLTASKGYLGGTKGDDPCYVAIRADKEDWGQYTPYYLESGSLTASLNAKGDSIRIAGTVYSHNGSTINVNAYGYNMLYVEDEQPKEPEQVVLGIDTVVITYLSNESDSTNNRFVYTFNFSQSDDFPTVLTDVVLSKPMELVEGTYTLDNELLSGLQLAQNQSDFELNLFYGSAYDFSLATLTLAQENGAWRYTMHMEDAIGSTYDFSFVQTPHIVLYPQPIEDEKDQPYINESKTVSTQSFVLDTLVWKDETVAKDGVIDIILTCKQSDATQTRPYIHLGMYSDVAEPAAGTNPVNGTEENGTFSASLGLYGQKLIPCYAAIVNDNGYATQLWFLVDGSVTLDYDANGNKLISGECTSYFGSTIRFAYQPEAQGIETVESEKWKVESRKELRNGQLFIIRGENTYTVTGQKVK